MAQRPTGTVDYSLSHLSRPGLGFSLGLLGLVSRKMILVSALLLIATLGLPAPQIGKLHLPSHYWCYMIEAGRETGVDPYLIAAVAAIESRFKQEARSSRGQCIGLMQLHRDTARSLGVDPYDPRDNVRGGALILRKFLCRYGGNLDRAMRRYNPAATRAYLKAVRQAYQQAKGELQ